MKLSGPRLGWLGFSVGERVAGGRCPGLGTTILGQDGRSGQPFMAKPNRPTEWQYVLCTDITRLRDAKDILRNITPEISGGRISVAEYGHIMAALTTLIARHERALTPRDVPDTEPWIREFPTYPPE